MAVHRVDGPGGPARPEFPARPRVGKKPDPVQPAQADRVDLSPEARQVASFVEAAKGFPEVRVEKVEKMREAIQQGTYSVDPRAVARAILEFEGDFER